jgi:hypothetical protein
MDCDDLSMKHKRTALMIVTDVALNGRDSGASIRVHSIKTLASDCGFQVFVSTSANAKSHLAKRWDLIILVSYSVAKFLRSARKATQNLWFDPVDSWTRSRVSLISHGDYRSILLFFRDLLNVWKGPKIDLITFISKVDADKEESWSSRHGDTKILPILDLDRHMRFSNQKRLVYVGDGLYLPNRQGLKFLKNVLDYLPNGYTIHVFGQNYDTEDKRFIFYGYQPVENLYYSQDIHLVPIQIGAGIKLKTVIPLWNGMLVIATPEGANGLKLVPNLILAVTPKDFAEKILEVIEMDNIQGFKPPKQVVYENDDTLSVKTWLKSRIKTAFY